MPWWGWILTGLTAAGLVFWLALRGWSTQDLREALGKIRDARRKSEEGIRDAEREQLDAIDAAERERLKQIQKEHDDKLKEIPDQRPDPADSDGLARRLSDLLARIRRNQGR